MADEQLALNSLQDLAKDAAKGLVEDTEVYKKAEDVVEKYPRLSATVSGVIEALATGEISTSFDVGKDKEIGFILNPEEKRAQLGFKMKFDDGGFIKGYQEGEVVDKTVLSVLEDYRDSFEDTELGKKNKTKVNSVIKKVKEAGYANADIKKVSTTKGINEFLSQKAIYSSKQSVRGTIQSVLGTASKNYSADLGAFWEQAKKAKNIELDKLVKTVHPNESYFGKLKRTTFNLENIGNVYKHINKISDKEARLFTIIKSFTGIRSQELARMTLDNISLKSAELTSIGGLKGGPGVTEIIGKNYTIPPIVQEAIRELQDDAIARGDTNLFTKSSNKLSSTATTDINKYLTEDLFEIKDGKKVKVKFNMKMFRNAILGAAEDLEYPESAIKDLGGHTKASDITKGYSRTTVFPQIKTDRLNYITNLQNKFLEAAGFESPKQFGIGSQLKYINKLESALDLTTVPKIESTVAQTQPSIEKLKAESGTLGETLEEIKLQQRKGLEEIQKSVQKTAQPKTTKVNRLLDRINKWKQGLKSALVVGGAGVTAEILTKSKPAIAATKVIAGAIPAFDPMQALNEAFGGKEGVLPTTKSGNILGFIPPTSSKESESWKDLLNIPTYPEGHPKEGQAIHSVKDYEKLNMPEELEQFEQQGRF